jgi:alkyl hydroperoxide reductase subunit AhpC
MEFSCFGPRKDNAFYAFLPIGGESVAPEEAHLLISIQSVCERTRKIMSLRIGSLAPDFEAETTQGRIRFHQWLGNSWGVLFSHPKDFTPICTTELGYLGKIQPEFEKRNVKVIGLSVDPVEDHNRWLEDVNLVGGCTVNYPLIADHDLKVAKLYDMLPEDAGESSEGRTAATNQTVRTVYIVGPDKLIKAMLVYPMSAGRNFDEVLRLIDALQVTSEHKVATPVNWKPGEDVVIAPSVSDEEALRLHPHGWRSVTPYLRFTRQPATGGASQEKLEEAVAQ